MASFFASVTLADLLSAAPRLEVQIALSVIHSAVWFVLIKLVLPPIFRSFISGMKAKQQFIKLNRDMFKKIFMYDIGDDVVKQVREVAEFESVMVQHALGGLLCVPSVLGLGDSLPAGVACAMARHGGLCEAGYEIEDTLWRMFELVFGGEEGRKKNPTALLVMLFIHHSVAQCLCMPLNIYYPNNVNYHEGIMLLQLAAFTATICQQYGFTLNVKTQAGLTQMKVAMTIAWVTIMWARVLRYGWVWYVLIQQFRNDGNTLVLMLSVPPLLLMSFFNLLIVKDATNKFVKFSFMRLDEHCTEALGSSAHLLGSFKGMKKKVF